MAYTLQELSSPELASMYQEYLRLSDRLASGEIDQLEALRRVEALEVVDNYDATWTIDPNSGTFVMEDANGVRTVDADPRAFQPTEHHSDDIGYIPEYTETQPAAEPPVAVIPPKRPWWKKALWGAGGLALAVGVFFAGFITHNEVTPDPVPAGPVEDPRPVVEGDGPSAERINIVLGQIASGDASRVKYAAPGESSDDMIRWATTVFGALEDKGYRFHEIRTEAGVSVLQVLDGNDKIIMKGDLNWTQEPSGEWVLDEVPVMSPVDTTVEITTTESPSPAEDESDESSEEETSDE